jgi:putative flippase GtrA
MAKTLFRQLANFAVVGGLGTITNLVIFFVIVDLLGTPALTGSVLSFCVAVTQNYVFNELWTFNDDGNNRVTRKRLGKFVLFSSLALGVNLALLQYLILNYEFRYYVIPQAAGIVAATIFNFASSRLITFRS